MYCELPLGWAVALKADGKAGSQLLRKGSVMREKIYVVSAGTQWKMRCDHCKEETKNTQLEAIKRAKEHVAELPAGSLSQILIQGDGGKWRTEWTYGQDPFPPRG